MNEMTLFRALREAAYPRMTQRCACGETITARLRDDDSIRLAVLAHNDSSAHRRWRDHRDDLGVSR